MAASYVSLSEQQTINHIGEPKLDFKTNFVLDYLLNSRPTLNIMMFKKPGQGGSQ